MRIPQSHPRFRSLQVRERLVAAYRQGLVVEQGLVAHGRGEAFDYLLGEETTPPAAAAERAAVRLLLRAKNPVVSVNGNTAALAAREVVRLAKTTGAQIEISLFHRTPERVRKVDQVLRKAGARTVLGIRPNRKIPGLEHPRALCSEEGIYRADVVLISLEDGDRAQALRRLGKRLIAIDLNPLSRTSRAVHIAIVDDVQRALQNMDRMARGKVSGGEFRFDNKANLARQMKLISAHLQTAGRETR